MIPSIDSRAVTLSTRPLNIFTALNGLHMAKYNKSLVGSSHFHPKQISNTRQQKVPLTELVCVQTNVRALHSLELQPAGGGDNGVTVV